MAWGEKSPFHPVVPKASARWGGPQGQSLKGGRGIPRVRRGAGSREAGRDSWTSGNRELLAGKGSGNLLGSFAEPGSRLIGRFVPAGAPGPGVSVRKPPLPSDPTSNLAPSKVLRPTRGGPVFSALTLALRGPLAAPPTPRRRHRGARLGGAVRPERGWRPLRGDAVHAPRRLGKAAGAGRASRGWPREHLSPGSTQWNPALPPRPLCARLGAGEARTGPAALEMVWMVAPPRAPPSSSLRVPSPAGALGQGGKARERPQWPQSPPPPAGGHPGELPA